MDWADYKNLGSWPFRFQQEKPFYNEGNLISNKNNPVWKTDFTGEPVTSVHTPCGYWYDYPTSEYNKGLEFPSSDVYPYPIDSCNCTDIYIGYTTQQMSIDENQSLNVENPITECSYSWEIISGGGSLSQATGLNTIYTAPSINEGCENNPVITLSVGGVECDSLRIAVNAYANVVWAVRIWSSSDCEEIVPGIFNCYLTNHTYDCAGNLMSGYPCLLTRQNSGAGASCDVCYGLIYPNACYSISDSISTLISISPIDLRSDSIKAGGCCPEQLLPM